MFEARIVQGAILKKIVEAIRELVTDANLDCNEEQGISMQVCILSLTLLLQKLTMFLYYIPKSFLKVPC